MFASQRKVNSMQTVTLLEGAKLELQGAACRLAFAVRALADVCPGIPTRLHLKGSQTQRVDVGAVTRGATHFDESVGNHLRSRGAAQVECAFRR
jgi:hypothetical protein